jgi:hypothetical protein
MNRYFNKNEKIGEWMYDKMISSLFIKQDHVIAICFPIIKKSDILAFAHNMD